MNRYFYILEDDNLGNKQIRMEGNVFGKHSFFLNEWTGCTISIGEAKSLIRQGEFFSTLDELVKYSTDLSKSEADAVYELYFEGMSSGDELNITDITNDTPCGDYFFDAE